MAAINLEKRLNIAALKALEDAKRLLSDPAKWGQGCFAKFEGEKVYINVKGYAAKFGGLEKVVPDCFCSVGALVYSAQDKDSWELAADTLSKSVGHLVKPEDVKLYQVIEDEFSIALYNDNQDHDGVMKLFDKAIELQKEKVNSYGK